MKKNSLLVLFVLFIYNTSNGQTENEMSNNSLQLSLAFSMDGTDNVGGFSISTEYTHFHRRKFSWSVGLTTTIHDGSVPVEYYTSNGVIEEGTVYYTTSGIQSSFAFGYSIIRTKQHNLHAQIGPLVRFQTSSNPEREGLALSPYVYFETLKNYQTLSFGGIGGISYSYTFQNNIFILLQGSLQIDSNNDAFNMVGIGVGKRFSRVE